MRSILRKVPKNYAEQTYASPSLLIRFAHQRRFKFVQRQLAELAPRSLVDWGAGDGFVIRELLVNLPSIRLDYIGLYDPVPKMVDSMREMLRDQIGLGQVHVYLDDSDMQLDLQENSVDVVLCLEVLEHMPLQERMRFYEFCRRYLTSEGVAIVEVPVEIGLTILIKEFGRVVMKGRPRQYQGRELARAFLGVASPDAPRFDPQNHETWIHSHKGFDYRRLRNEMRNDFSVRQIGTTPIGLIPPFLGNQSVMFALRLRE